jgi:exodeoxyribonuclease V beta subunit
LIWLKACLNPQNGRLIRAAMATTTMGLHYEDLEHLYEDEFALDQRVAEFSSYGDLWRNHGILPAIRQIILEQNLSERLLSLSSGERTLTNLLHLAELLQTESGLRDGELGLIRFLQESIDDELQEAKDNVLRLESDQGLIRVVTIHKSKGLEYPLVFLPFVCGYKEVRTNRLTTYRYHIQEDPLHPLKLELIKGCVDKDAANAKMEVERLQEELRLLYVAITRARHACWLGMAPLKVGNNSSPTLHKGAMGYLLSGGQVIQARDLKSLIVTCIQGLQKVRIVEIEPSAPERLLPQEARQSNPKEALRFQGEGFESWWIASYSALKFSKGDMKPSAPDNDNDEPENASEDQSTEEDLDLRSGRTSPWSDSSAQKPLSIHEFPAGASHGVFLHDLLESAAKVGFDTLSKDKHALDHLVDGVMRGRHYDEWETILKDWLAEFLSQPFSIEHGNLSLAALSVKDCLTEMEFWFEANDVRATSMDVIFKQAALHNENRPVLNPSKLNGVLKGFIDLVFRHDDKYYVADYKSNWLGKDAEAYTENAIRHALLEKRYDAQYVLYLLALHRYLKSRLGSNYDYERDIGGAVYFFLRGVGGPVGGVHFEKPSKESIEKLDVLFRGNVSQEIQHASE